LRDFVALSKFDANFFTGRTLSKSAPKKRLELPQRLESTGRTPNASRDFLRGKNRNFRDSPKRLFYCQRQ
jgi:hypothetical protein